MAEKLQIGDMASMQQTPTTERVGERFSRLQEEAVQQYYDRNKIKVVSFTDDLKPRLHTFKDVYARLHEEAQMVLSAKKAPLIDAGKSVSTVKLDMYEIVHVIRTIIPFCVADARETAKGVADIREYLDTIDEEPANGSVYMFDFERGIYVSPEPYIDKFLVAITGVAKKADRDVLSNTIAAGDADSDLIPYLPFIPLPRYKVVVGNGVYNLLTHRLEPFDPRFMAFSAIGIKYDPNMIDGLDKKVYHNINFETFCDSFANHNPDRAKLLSQICKYVIIGRAPVDSGFIVQGPGGDGKSTFFENMLGNIVGTRNTSVLTFSDIEQDDQSKMAEVESASMTLGTDNNSKMYIKNTASLKRLVTRGAFSVRPVYQMPRTITAHGCFIQLVNEVPRFAETGAAMRRRFTAVHAQNSYVGTGEADSRMMDLVSRKKFAQHVLAYILEKVPYYNGFEQVDAHLIEESAEDSNPVVKFIRQLVDGGFFDGGLRAIPVTHLHAAYKDWYDVNMGGGSPQARASFTKDATTFLVRLGFSDRTQRLAPNSAELVHDMQYDISRFKDAEIDGKFIQRHETDKTKTECFVRSANAAASIDAHKTELMLQVRTNGTECSVYDYLGLSDAIYLEMSDTERAQYEREVNDLSLKQTDKTDMSFSGQSNDKTSQLNNQINQTLDAAKPQGITDEDKVIESDVVIPANLEIVASSSFGRAYNKNALDEECVDTDELIEHEFDDKEVINKIIDKIPDVVRAMEALNMEEPIITTELNSIRRMIDATQAVMTYTDIVRSIQTRLEGLIE